MHDSMDKLRCLPLVLILGLLALPVAAEVTLYTPAPRPAAPARPASPVRLHHHERHLRRRRQLGRASVQFAGRALDGREA